MTPYIKLNSHGNDFILIDTNDTKSNITVDDIIYYSRRDKIGCDQFFIINTEDKDNIYCEVYNQDGSKACQCGNGLRATMLYLNRKYNLLKANLIVCDVCYEAKIYKDQISVNMGSPKYVNIPETSNNQDYLIAQHDLVISIESIKDNITFSFIPLSIGNHHCVVFSADCDQHKKEICNVIDQLYDSSMNIGFIKNAKEFLNNTEIAVDLIVKERGAGYTDSCGSGATAAAICMFKLYELENESKVSNSTISIKQKGGTLCIKKKYNPDMFELIGPSSYDGEGNLE
jgi:diaminopimelate epimerase